MKEEIILKLNINELNIIMAALYELPFKQVAHVIGAIKTQADPQVQMLSQNHSPH
jgi:hypothetical protein